MGRGFLARRRARRRARQALHGGILVSLGLDLIEAGRVDMASAVEVDGIVLRAIPDGEAVGTPPLKGRRLFDVTLTPDTTARITEVAQRYGLAEERVVVVAANAGLAHMGVSTEG